MLRKNGLQVFAVLAVLATCGLATANVISPITVPNYSFESPDVSASPYYALFPTQNTPSYDAWASTATAGVVLNGQYGRAYTNLDGTQCGWMDGNTATTFVFQDLTGADATFQVGKAYTLTVGLGAEVDSAANGRMIEIALFYRSADTTGNEVAGTYAEYGSLSNTSMTNYSVNVPVVQSTDAWAGQQIAIWIRSPGDTSGGTWDFDNVRLESTATPEPSSILLLVTGLIGLLACAWRKRR